MHNAILNIFYFKHKLFFYRNLFIFILSIIILSVIPIHASSNFYLSKTSITAHRGYHLNYPENTLDAIKQAIECHCDYVEFDVQQTKDGVIVLSHDSNLKRLTQHNVNLWDIDSKNLRRYPLLDSNKTSKNPQFIPTLKEALGLCRGKILLNIEIKYTGHEKNIVPKLLKLIQSYGMEQTCMVTSFYKPFLFEIKNINPYIKTGYITSNVTPSLLTENIDVISISFPNVTPRLVTQIQENNKEIHVWTVNKPADIERLLSLNVDNIITDHPELCLSIRDAFYDESSFYIP